MNPTTENLRHATLPQLISQLETDQVRKHDMVVPASHVTMNTDGGAVCVREAPIAGEQLAQDLASIPGVEVSGHGRTGRATLEYVPLRIAHDQLAARLGIPRKYYHRMHEDAPALLAENVNTWTTRAGRNYLVRTFRPRPESDLPAGVLRAVLSDRYKVIDNLDLLYAVLDAIRKTGIDVNVRSCDLTSRRMYVSVSAPGVTFDAPDLMSGYRNPEGRGTFTPTLTAGLVFSNSETGHGSFQVLPRPTANVCTNALTWKDDRIRRVHLGSQLEQGAVRWSRETRRRGLRLLQHQVQDAVKTFLSASYLRRLSARMLEAGDRELDHPINAVTAAADFAGLSEGERADVVDYFVRGGDTRAVGVTQALTYHAQRAEGADAQYGLEAGVQDVLKNMHRFDTAE